MSGPTSAIISYLKMQVSDMAAGAPLDLRLSTSSLSGDPGTERLAGLIQAFIGMGGNMLTFTVTDVEGAKEGDGGSGGLPPPSCSYGRLVGLLRNVG